MEAAGWTTTGLWLGVIASGLYHGVNPGMGWPLAVSAGMMGRGWRDLVAAMAPLAAGHLLAMLAMLLPFALMVSLLDWQREIRLTASVLVIGFGLFRLVNRRHPRALARIPPTQLALWSFAIALAHGAGLMLLPIYLGIDAAAAGAPHGAAMPMGQSLTGALAVALVHTLAMVAAGGALALAVHLWLGLRFLPRSWFNLDAVWAASLILIGGISLAAAV